MQTYRCTTLCTVLLVATSAEVNRNSPVTCHSHTSGMTHTYSYLEELAASTKSDYSQCLVRHGSASLTVY